MTFKEIWSQVREKFPPARVVAFLTPFVATLAGLVAAWLANHAPLIAEQVDATELMVIFGSVVASFIGLAYKWLDGRAKWERQQVEAHVELAKMGFGPDAVQPGVLEPSPVPADTDLDPEDEWDEDLALSLPDDIDPSDSEFDPEDETLPRDPQG